MLRSKRISITNFRITSPFRGSRDGVAYKFSAKEKDEETSYSYFGARYLASEFSFWLSVDPMSDKYPHQSGYSYCGWRPINVIDPDGLDEWDVNKHGDVKWKNNNGGDKTHTLFALDGKGKRTGESTTVKDRKIFDQLTKDRSSGFIEGSDGNKTSDFYTLRYAKAGNDGKDDMANTFNFLAKNTDVEWAIYSSGKNGESNYALGTWSLGPNNLWAYSPSSSNLGISNVTSMIHSHPLKNNENDEKESMYMDKALSKSCSYPYYTYMAKSSNLYLNNKKGNAVKQGNMKHNYKNLLKFLK